MHDVVSGRCFISERTVLSAAYLDISLRSGHLELSSNKTRHFHTRVISWGITSITRCLADGSTWGATTAWPPRSPELTPMDFYLWGYIKNQVQRAKNNYLQQLKALITDGVVMEPTKHVSKHADRGRIPSGYLPCQHWYLLREQVTF